jgi:hypothetical protein
VPSYLASPFFDDVRAIRQLQTEIQILLGQQHGLPVALSAESCCSICCTISGANPSEGSSSSKVWISRRGAGDCEHPPLAAAQRNGAARDELPHNGEQLVAALVVPAGRSIVARGQPRNIEVFADRKAIVVLPAPLRPSKATTSPPLTTRLTPSRT